MHQCFPVRNLNRPPDSGGSPILSGVPTRTQVPIRSLASLVGSASFLGGWSPASPTESTTADTRRTAATRMARHVVDLSIGEAPVSGVTKLKSPPPPNDEAHRHRPLRRRHVPETAHAAGVRGRGRVGAGGV